MKLFFFDLETTGTNPGRHGIHQISGQIVIDGETKENFNWYVRPNPRAQIDPKALQVSGVTEEQIRNYPPMEQVYGELIDMLSKYVDRYNPKDKFFLVGYNNTSFDDNFLRGFFRQNGDEFFGSWFWSNAIDVMVLATQYLLSRRAEMDNFKLATVAKFMNIQVDPDKLHGADYDIYLTRAVYDLVCSRRNEDN